MKLKHWLLHLLVTLRMIPQPQLIPRFCDRHPNPKDLETGCLAIAANHSLLKNATFRCPGGCGERLLLSLNSRQQPHWELAIDWLGRPSLTPSIRQMNACRCHFWIRAGQVCWCNDMNQVSSGLPK